MVLIKRLFSLWEKNKMRVLEFSQTNLLPIFKSEKGLLGSGLIEWQCGIANQPDKTNLLERIDDFD